MAPTIQCKGIKKFYGSKDNRVEALKGIDLEVEGEGLTLLVGPSGSGKTTLLSIISTILTPDVGELFILGHRINGMGNDEKTLFCRNHIGMVFQSLFLIPTLTVVENIALPLVISGYSQANANEKALELLDKMHLQHRADDPPTILSKGQQQRVAIARAMVHESKIITCDEPTSALDEASGLEIMTLLRDLALHSSRTVLVVTHDHRTYPFANRIIMMNDGKIEVNQ